MRIATFRVENYKSFSSSGIISFEPGFNVVVGQNNVGKTALSEALSLTFAPNPHFSRATVPSVGVPPDPVSHAVAAFELSADEVKEILAREMVGPIYVPAGAPDTDIGVLARRFSSLISEGAFLEATYKIGGVHGGGQIVSAYLRGYEFDPEHGDRYLVLWRNPSSGELEIDPSTPEAPSAANQHFALRLAEILRQRI